MAGAVYTRWVTQRDAERRDGCRACAAQISVARGVRASNVVQTDGKAAGLDGCNYDPGSTRQLQPRNRWAGHRVSRAAVQLGASAHNSGYLSPRPPPVSTHRGSSTQQSGGTSSYRGTNSARLARRGPRASMAMTSWEGRQARRQAQREELHRVFPHLPINGHANARARAEQQPLAIRGDGHSALPILRHLHQGQPQAS